MKLTQQEWNEFFRQAFAEKLLLTRAVEVLGTRPGHKVPHGMLACDESGKPSYEVTATTKSSHLQDGRAGRKVAWMERKYTYVKINHLVSLKTLLQKKHPSAIPSFESELQKTGRAF